MSAADTADADIYGFAPSAARARAFDGRMHAALASSLHHLRDRCAGKIAYDDLRLSELISRIEAGERFAPSLFADYFELVSALLSGDPGHVRIVFDRVAKAEPAPLAMSVVTLRESGRSAQYRALMEESGGIGFGEPPSALHSRFVALLDNALALVEKALPEFGGELRGLVRQIVTVTGDLSKPMLFDGGSHYQLWGALFLNIDRQRDVPGLIEALAHESAHSLLFGFSIDEPLVENEDEALFASPLRLDKRPMDGIYHATFVSARMHWAIAELARSEAADNEVRSWARGAMARNRESFESGDEIVRRHGRLTATGRAVMEEARAYMGLRAPA